MSKKKDEPKEDLRDDAGHAGMGGEVAAEQQQGADTTAAAQDETGRRKVIYYADVVPGWAERNEPPKLSLDPHAPCGICVPVEVEIPIDPTIEQALPATGDATE